MRLAQVLTVSVLTLAMTAEVAAERRPGLGGKYAARNMTAAQGSLTLLAGPTSSQALGAVSNRSAAEHRASTSSVLTVAKSR